MKYGYIVCALLLAAGFVVDPYVTSLTAFIRHPLLDFVMSWFSNIGSIFFILVFVTSLFLWEEKKREWIPILILSFAASLIASYIFKFIVARPRPNDLEKFIFATPDYSFPSTHASIAFSCLPVLDMEFSPIRWFWIGFAALVSFSRIYLGQHHLSDVIAGCLLGYGVGLLLISVEKKYGIFRRLGS